jgi:hypothetical protein
LKEGADAYVFCHSPENLTAPQIARELYHRVSQHISLSPLPWDEIKPDVPEQPTLF